jgi:hypothetical protein
MSATEFGEAEQRPGAGTAPWRSRPFVFQDEQIR